MWTFLPWKVNMKKIKSSIVKGSVDSTESLTIINHTKNIWIGKAKKKIGEVEK